MSQLSRSRIKTIENLRASEGLLIVDWAMKFVPLHFREAQKDWFAKKGRSWHVAVLIYKQDNNLRVSMILHHFTKVIFYVIVIEL